MNKLEIIKWVVDASAGKPFHAAVSTAATTVIGKLVASGERDLFVELPDDETLTVCSEELVAQIRRAASLQRVHGVEGVRERGDSTGVPAGDINGLQ